MNVWVYWNQGPQGSEVYHMNRINAFRSAVSMVFAKVLHGSQEWAAIDLFQQRQPLCIQADMLVELNYKSPT